MTPICPSILKFLAQYGRVKFQTILKFQNFNIQKIKEKHSKSTIFLF